LNTPVFAILGGLLGLVVGSFVGTIVRREPGGWRGLLLGRSRCPTCGTILSARDLVPLWSWFATRGRCRHCGAALPVFYPMVEILAAVVGALAFGLAVPPFALPVALLGWWLLALALIDLCSWRLPDVLTLPLVIVGLVAAWLDFLPRTGLARAIAGAILGYVALAGIAWVYRRLRHREGLGLGDAKLLAAAGAWLGPLDLPWVLLLAAPLGLGLALVRSRQLRGDTAVPFGPPLALAFWLLFLWRAAA
jgi:leader peptidase (prepilin peptidase) / N-methyltransferase